MKATPFFGFCFAAQQFQMNSDGALALIKKPEIQVSSTRKELPETEKNSNLTYLNYFAC